MSLCVHSTVLFVEYLMSFIILVTPFNACLLSCPHHHSHGSFWLQVQCFHDHQSLATLWGVLDKSIVETSYQLVNQNFILWSCGMQDCKMIHDKLSLYHDLYGKGSKYPFSGCFLLKNGLSTKMSSSDFRAPMFFTDSGKTRCR